MKILRLFDSLKFLRTIFVAVACAFFIFPAHAELQDTELPVGYKRLTGLKLESASIKITDFYLTGNDTLRFRAKSSAASNWIGSYTTSSADNNYSFYASMSSTGKYARYNGQTGGSGVSSGTWYSVVMSPNGVSGVRNPSSWTPSNFTCSVPLYIGNLGEGTLVPAPDVSFSGNIVVDGRLTLIPCERESDGVMGYYSLQHNSFFTSNIGTITSLGYDTSHMVEVPIKIATTHYNETKFAPVETRLDAAVAAVNTVVTQTMSQAQAIDTIATSKQTRPDEGCSAKYCLLVEDEQGVPHWYPIAGANGVAHALPAGYTELQYLESTVASSQAYINTGLNFNSDYMYEITYAKGGAANIIMGVRKDTDYSAVGNFSVTYCSSDTCVYSSTETGSTPAKFNDATFGVKHTVKYQQSTSTLLFDNTDKWVSNWLTQTSIPYDVYLFAFNSVGTAGGSRTGYVRIYSYSVKNANGAFVQNFVPVRHDSDGVLGMYDLADSNPATAFHTNAGTGTFTAGPDM